MDTKMKNIISEIASHCIEEIDEHINNTIAWNMLKDLDGDDHYELELKIKQQILFTLIKTVMK